jgi:glutathione S-transferase
VPDLILHQYDTSPFSEKVRLAFGRKRLAWRSVEQPTVMPKPELIPLTGGYRKIPVLQIGADVYCDSQCILREIERRHPDPPVFAGDEATHMAFAAWSDRVLFQAAVGVVFGQIGDAVPKAFLDDRSKLMGRSFDVAEMKAAVPILREALRAQLGWLEAQLGDGRAFLLGPEPGLADFTTYHPLWFLQRFHPRSAAVLDAVPAVAAWTGRVAAVGHGERQPMEPREALAIARDAQPATKPQADPGEPNGRRPGERVAVLPDDYGRDPVEGELVASSPQEIAIRRHDPQLGELVVHFPRAGFVVLPR